MYPKMKDLIEEVEKEMLSEDREAAKNILKERIREIKDARKILQKLELKYEELLEKDIDEIIE